MTSEQELHARIASLEAQVRERDRTIASQARQIVDLEDRIARRGIATTIDALPPEDLLDRITPIGVCAHKRVSLRPDPNGNAVRQCLDCGEEP